MGAGAGCARPQSRATRGLPEAGIAGGIHALFLSYVTAGETFTITVPLTVVLMGVLGGTRYWAGPVVGATLITTLLYAFTAGDHAVAGKAVFGALLIAVILFLPDGVLGAPWLRRRRERAPVDDPGGGAIVATAAVSAAESAAARAPASRVASPAIGEPLLVASGIAKSFSGVHALENVSLAIRRNEILGLLGPNGSGKSTFINLVSGHYRASAGSLRFDGRDITNLDAHRIARLGIARTYQIPRPFAHMSVLDNVALATMFGGAIADPVDARRRAMTWLEFTGLVEKATARPDDLNLHQRKFLELARALASRPRLVLLDEVLSGLTPGEINEAIDLIRKIRDRGATIVFVEHVMRAVMALADRVAVLNHGKLIASGPANEVMSNSEVVTAYLGAAHA